jgi:hypothetical protein
MLIVRRDGHDFGVAAAFGLARIPKAAGAHNLMQSSKPPRTLLGRAVPVRGSFWLP